MQSKPAFISVVTTSERAKPTSNTKTRMRQGFESRQAYYTPAMIIAQSLVNRKFSNEAASGGIGSGCARRSRGGAEKKKSEIPVRSQSKK